MAAAFRAAALDAAALSASHSMRLRFLLAFGSSDTALRLSVMAAPLLFSMPLGWRFNAGVGLTASTSTAAEVALTSGEAMPSGSAVAEALSLWERLDASPLSSVSSTRAAVSCKMALATWLTSLWALSKACRNAASAASWASVVGRVSDGWFAAWAGPAASCGAAGTSACASAPRSACWATRCPSGR